jgi:uncharacterized protein YbjT (DUF2867 family)
MNVFISGATGYLGRALAQSLVARGHRVRGLVRPGAESKLPDGCETVTGNPLDGFTFKPQGDVVVHLVGTPKPAPWKERQFRAVDLPSLRASVDAAARESIGQFVYVSIAQPAPVMRSYIAVRQECEAILRASGLHATVLRPWYVLGPGHWWPYALLPAYKLMEVFPFTRDDALRLALVTHAEMTRAMVWAIENPHCGQRVFDVPSIRARARELRPA